VRPRLLLPGARSRHGRTIAPVPDTAGASCEQGVDLQSRVPGELLAWRRTTTGEWVGWVCLPVRRGEEIRYVYQYVVAAALSPREDVPDRRSP
jgi:hypothetical protein